jgi:hypothetical protein
VNEILLLVSKRVLVDTNWKYVRNLDANFESLSLNIPIEVHQLKLYFENFEIKIF